MINTVSHNEYSLRDGLLVKDKADGIASVNKISQNTYALTVNGKKLLLPTCSDVNNEEVAFSDSKKFTFIREDNFLVIKETDRDGKNTYFVDVTLAVHDIAYDLFSYKPSPMTKTIALEKIAATPLEGMQPLLQVYNRHGVAVFGQKSEQYQLYWGPSNEKQLKNIPLQEAIFLRNGEVTAKGTNCMVYLKSRCKNFVSGEKNYSLNNEEAFLLPLKDQEKIDRILEKVVQLKI